MSLIKLVLHAFSSKRTHDMTNHSNGNILSSQALNSYLVKLWEISFSNVLHPDWLFKGYFLELLFYYVTLHGFVLHNQFPYLVCGLYKYNKSPSLVTQAFLFFLS